jgi:hypothetical protein
VNIKEESARTEKALNQKLREQEALTAEIRRLRGRLEALRFLINQENDPNAIGEFVVVKPRYTTSLTGLIEHIFRDNPSTELNTPDLLQRLKLKGWGVTAGSASTVATIAKRLEKRGLLKRTEKDKYVAWIWAPQ